MIITNVLILILSFLIPLIATWLFYTLCCTPPHNNRNRLKSYRKAPRSWDEDRTWEVY